MNYQKVYMNHIHSSSLLCQLAQMWRSQLLCDALICTGNVVTKAHRVVLLAACPMLQSMENASIGTELEVRLAADIKQEGVNTFLQYLYEGFMLLTEENVKHVEKVARLLQVDSVIKCCSDFFKCLEKSTGKLHNGNYKFDKYDLLEFRHVRATGLQKTYHERLMKRISESPHSPSPTGGKRQRMQRPSSPPTDLTAHRTDDARTMAQSYMSAMPPGGTGSVRSGGSSRSDSPSVVEIIEDSLELIQREKPVPGQPEPSRLAQQKTSISVASHVSNSKDTRVVSISDDSGGGRAWTTDSFSDRLQGLVASQSSAQHSPQISASPKIPFRDSHQAKASHHQPSSSFMPRIPSNQMSFAATSQPPPPPLHQAGTLNIAPLSQTFSQGFQQEQSPSETRSSQMSSDTPVFTTSTPQSHRTQTTHPPPVKLSFATGSASQAGPPSTSQQQDSGQVEKTEKGDGDSSRPQEGHDPGPSESSEDTADLAIVKIEKVDDETGGLLMQVDNGQGDGPRTGQFTADDEHEYDETDLTGDFSQDDISNEASMLQGDQSGAGAMYLGPTSEPLIGSYTDLTRRRRTLQKAYNPNNLVAAVKAVQDGSMNAYQAAQAYGVPRRTISYRVKRERENYLRTLRIMESMGQRANLSKFPNAGSMPISTVGIHSQHLPTSSVESMGERVNIPTFPNAGNMPLSTGGISSQHVSSSCVQGTGQVINQKNFTKAIKTPISTAGLNSQHVPASPTESTGLVNDPQNFTKSSNIPKSSVDQEYVFIEDEDDTVANGECSNRTRRRRKDYKDYHRANLEMAVTVVMSGKMNAIQASNCYGVPSRTIYDRVSKARNTPKIRKQEDENFASTESSSPDMKENIQYILVKQLGEEEIIKKE